MSYFDHVRCSACKAMIDPEQVATRPGQGISCPRCGAPLSMGDLFGLKDAFLEEEQEELSLDDALSRMKAPTASVAPPPQSPRAAAGGAPRGAAPPPQARATGAARSAAAPPPKAGPKQLTDRAAPPAGAAKPAAAKPAPGKPAPGKPVALPPQESAKTEPTAAPGSALDAMRALRKKK